MTLVGVSRVVPSGKVYRQIFDDEINLVRTLGEVRSKRAHQKLPQIPGKIPLVRDVETCSGHGFLSHRQQTWVEGMPNDDITENPVQYKEAATVAFLKAQESDNVIAAREVRGLAEVIIPEKKSSNIIERISESRRCRYEETVETLRQDLAHVGKEMELCFLEPGRLFLSKLSESDHTIESLFHVSDDNTSLETYTIQDFENMWNLVFQETLKRRQWIRELDKALRKAEVDRTERIKVLLNKYTKILEDIAYFLSSDVHRFIHKEAMMINQALLANRRALARLFINLMEADLKRDVFHQRKLEEKMMTWRAIKKQKVITSFRQFMESEKIQSPSAVKSELENMLKDQLSLTEKRTTLLYSLGNLLSQMHSKAEINEWYESVVALNKRIDTHNVQHMMKIRLQYEKVCQECLSKVQECKQKLLDEKICTEKEAENIVNPSFYQLVGKLQSRFEQEVEMMDSYLEHMVKHTETNCRNLYQYFQDALVVLDTHHQNLSQQENELHNKMNDCRNKHENLNKLREVHLDMSVDKLRTQSSDEKLKSQLEKVYAALDSIRVGYTTFHQDLLAKVSAYPDNILRELISYSTLVSRYFYVKEIYRGKPLRKPEAMSEEEAEMSEDAEELEEMEEATEGTLEPKIKEAEEEEEEEKHVEENTDRTAEADESEQMEKQGETESSAPESDGAAVPGDGASLVLESDDVEKSDEGSSPVPEVGEIHESEDAAAPTLVRFSRTPLHLMEVTLEFFTTSSGNTYNVIQNFRKFKTKKSEKYYTGQLKGNFLPPYLEEVYLSESFFTDVRRQIRLQFFEHLENSFAETLSKAWVIVAAKKEEISSELQLRIHLHEPRQQRIERDVYHVRMAELRLHNERLIRHCTGVVEALNSEKAAFFKLRVDQNHVSKTFRRRIQDMENIFLTESRAEKLMTLSNNLHMELINHVEVMQLSLRSYRQYLEEALGKLRDANTDFLKACRLFANGGNFSPEELEAFMKCLQKENGRIDFVEGLIMIDLEKMESNYLEQATEVISKFESKFHFLALDRVFIEKIQRFLTNIQVKIKSEVANSNFQTQTLNAHLEKLMSRIDAYAHPNVDKESMTSEVLYEFTKFVMEEVKKRSKYLNCLLFLEPAYSYMQETTVQSSGTTPIQSDSLLHDGKVMVMGIESTPLMNPSRMGKPAFDDAAISVIRHLIGVQRVRRMQDIQQDKEPGGATPGGGGHRSSLQGTPPNAPGGGGHRSSLQGTQPNASLASMRKSSSVGKRISGSMSSIQKYTKITRNEKKLQIFGDKPKDNDSEHLKGIIFGTLWDNFDIMMGVAEDFYKKDKHQITRPEFLQETYDQCIDVLGQKLIAYLLQVDEYRIACISEFRNQLKKFEEQLPHVTRLIVGKHLRDHEHRLRDATEQIRHSLQDQLQKWDIAKDKNKNRLRPSLGHPDNLPQLEALCQEEEERQRGQAEGIRLCTKQLEGCVIDCAQRFVSTLAASTEKMLVELDDCLTVDDVQQGKVEIPREKTCTLIRRKKAGLSLEMEESKLVAERGSRTWPGIPRTTLVGLPNKIICRETATLTTAKTTLGHVAAVEERDAVYVKFKQLLEAEFARIKEEKTALLMKAQHWADWWKKSVQKIKQLYA
ncbi:coiled-coil domain-containing protein 180 [Rhineura floridana]|uniref:coiled-coil domain-containing protein 180 n=1 Tax=Rhineura floridana TaxID=261503 RepID=UPI002AC85D20|nr:coiled-coil domain-containing protein 180 [Rhineura floridana]XP_061460268.1 coiled-coil domain-containing protein 180 [Rhineura floridana]XP_061460269.1 coiled-coil domain-containing protein 180 [Rhineura floridana]